MSLSPNDPKRKTNTLRHRRLTALTIAVIVAVSVLASCGSETSSDGVSSGAPAQTTHPGDAGGSASDAPSIPVTPADADGCRTPEDAQAETEAPDPDPPTGDETAIEVTDDIAGCGDLVEAGSTVSVQYVLKSKSSGEVVDSSWSRGAPFDVTLGQGSVISGWETGIPGMRAGGRRTLLLGPEYGYGDQGSPPAIAPGDTLVFVIDALAVS